jgi:UDP-N-acetylmuramate dehydrogenase
LLYKQSDDKLIIMLIQNNVSLIKYSTMQLGGIAKYLSVLENKSDIPNLVLWAKEKNVPIIMIGGGSNIFWSDQGFEGLVIVNKLKGFDLVEQESGSKKLTVGAGEAWDSVVKRTVDAGLSGLAELSLIPGYAGATPVQNVGAYGREVSDVLISVDAYDCKTDQFVTIKGSECGFGYRTSRFKTNDKGRFLITNVTFKLTKAPPSPPFYPAVVQYFADHNISNYTVEDIREAVVSIRSAKLPDPNQIANNGSFFGNPVLSRQRFIKLNQDYPGIVFWEINANSVKVSAAWLLENAGFRDYHDQETGMATWPKQPLIFINENAKSTSDLIKFRDKVARKIKSKFNVVLAQEPELLP